MKKYIVDHILILLIAVCMTSCVTLKQRERICNTCAVKTQTKDSIIYKNHDTTIYLQVAGPIQYLENPCKLLCDSLGNLKHFEVSKKENGINGSIKSVGNSIVFHCEADSLKAVIKGLVEKESYHKKEEADIKYIPCVDERTRFDGFTFWWFWITAGILFIYLVIKAIKDYFHI